MMFALDSDDGALQAFASPLDAAAHCKPVDVEDGYWLFFDDDGSPLEARFERPAETEGDRLGPGTYTLSRALSGLWLQERLGRIASVRGCGLGSVDDLVETLRINRGKRASSAARRG